MLSARGWGASAPVDSPSLSTCLETLVLQGGLSLEAGRCLRPTRRQRLPAGLSGSEAKMSSVGKVTQIPSGEVYQQIFEAEIGLSFYFLSGPLLPSSFHSLRRLPCLGT